MELASTELASSSSATPSTSIHDTVENVPAGTVEKRKRGRPPKRQAGGVGTPKPPPPKRQAVVKVLTEEEDVWEDVCFICFDGGSLVLCDRKGCPKAYHPSCIKRDEAYFQSKGKWNCGWHICSVCQRTSQYMCYTCTNAICKGCTKETDFVRVRGNMGFCTTCMKTIMLIENKDQTNNELVQVDFDDKTSWEYLFKVYWISLKQRISLTLHELTRAKNLSEGVSYVANNQKLHDSRSGVTDGNGLITNGHCEQLNLQYAKDLKQLPSSGKLAVKDASLIRCKEWASKRLLEFVAHMKNGDTSVLSQFDVQELLLEYIKKNGLLGRDCQVICDFRLTNLFGKSQISQSEMLKLLECHILVKEDLANSSTPAGIGGTPLGHLEHKENKETSTRLQNPCQKFEMGVPQKNLDDYAAIDVHNTNLIYLPRSLMASLTRYGNFHEKVVGSIVRIRISNSDQKQDMYRLVQVAGTNKAPAPYIVGNKTIDVVLEVLNLDKKEIVAIDTISDQEFSPDECRNFREIVKCGLVKVSTVGEVKKKAMELLTVRLDERIDAEVLKLNQLCDQTREKERINELRMRIAKLQLLKTPEECQRRFSGMIQVNADPKMSPDYDSEQDPEGGDDQKPEVYISSKSPDTKSQDEELINGQHKVDQKSDGGDLSDQAVSRRGTENSAAVLETGSTSPLNESETEKLWYYRDPYDKSQGPFSIVQLREWSTTGYFPPDMRIWTTFEHEDSILLTDALNGQFHTAAHLLYNLSLQSHQVRGSIQISEAVNKENKDNLSRESRDDNRIDGTLKGGTGGVQGKENNESGSSHVFDGNCVVESRGNNELGRTDVVLGGTSGMQTTDNNEYGKVNVMGDTGLQSGGNNESGRTDMSGSESCGFTSSGFSPKEVQLESSPPCELKELNSSLGSDSCGFTSSGFSPKGVHPGNSPPKHNSSSDKCQIHQLPSSTNESSHVSSHYQGGSHGSEGYRYSPKHEKQVLDGSATIQVVGRPHENKFNDESNESQCLGRNRISFPINLNTKDIDLNSGLSPATNSDSSKQSCDMELPDLPSRAPKESNPEPEAEAAENYQHFLDVHRSGMPGSPSPMLKLSNRSRVMQVNNSKAPPSLKTGYQDLRPSRSSASSPVVGGAQFQNVADDWGGYPQPLLKPVLDGWSSGLVSFSSLKPHEVARVHTATANVDPLAHMSACNPTHNISSWHGMVEPLEFVSLAEEAVSDLLAEVDAMEFQSGGMASPTTAMRCEDEMMKFYKNEGFNIEDLSPVHNPRKSDAMSSTGDIQLPCQSTASHEPVGISDYDPSKRSSRYSSNNGDREARSADVRVNQREAAHPGLSLTMSQDMYSTLPQTTRMGVMDSGIMGRAPEQMNLFWGAPPQGVNNIGWDTHQGTSYGNPNLNRGAYNPNVGLQWDGQRKYVEEKQPGPRDYYASHGGDVGYGRDRPSWNRQPFGSGGGYTRSPKGQHVCKFYESGYCRKGASCEDLHQ